MAEQNDYISLFNAFSDYFDYVTVIDVISRCRDSSTVTLINVPDNKEIAQYNGKDSIPTKYNEYPVLNMDINSGTLRLFIQDKR